MIDPLGITTVSGNHTVDNTTRDALAVCTAYGIRVPVAKGSPGPLISDQVLAVEIHGTTGLDGPVLPPASFDLDPRHAVDFIIDTVMAHAPKSVTLVPVGPYTNIALALRKEPRIIERVQRVVAMGGPLQGATSPRRPCSTSVPMPGPPMWCSAPTGRSRWSGLDLTHQALATPELQDRVRAIGGSLSQFILDIWDFIATTHGGLLQIACPAIHDACCIAALIDPTVFTTENADIRVETSGRWTNGMTVCNFEKMGGMRHFGGTASAQLDFRHHVAMQLDHAKFCDMIVEAVARLTLAKG